MGNSDTKMKPRHNGVHESLKERNDAIYRDYMDGVCVVDLADKYGVSGYSNGSLPASYAGGCGFKSHPRIHRLGRDVKSAIYGSLVQTVRTPACHAGGRRFETGTSRHWM